MKIKMRLPESRQAHKFISSLSFSPEYTSGSSFTCSDLATAKAVAKRTYNSAVELFAMLCKQYSLSPLGDGVIISHKEGHARGISSNHGDPEHLWKGLGLTYTMSRFRQDVKAAIPVMLFFRKPIRMKTSTAISIMVRLTSTWLQTTMKRLSAMKILTLPMHWSHKELLRKVSKKAMVNISSATHSQEKSSAENVETPLSAGFILALPINM